MQITGKTLLFVNSGGKKKQFTLERAKKHGATVLLLNQTMDCPKSLVDHFIEANNYDHNECCEKLHSFLQLNADVHIDGAVTFWEDDVPLLARICEEFGLIGNTVDTAINTRNKHTMRTRLQETGLGNPLFALVKTNRDLEKAVKEIGLPAVMKPAWGSDSEFVVLVQEKSEAKSTLRYLINNCTEQFNPIFKYNSGMFLYEEYMEGLEVSAECFVQYGIPHVIGINEKEPMKPPYFVECGDIVPARLDDETQQAVIKLAEASLIALGVRDSLAHVEIKITSDGPKIVEVGSRMGGDDIYLYVKHIWGVDMVDIALSIACGDHAAYKKKEPRGAIITKYFIPLQSGVISTIQQKNLPTKTKQKMHLHLTKKIGEAVLVPPEGFENAGWMWVKEKSYQQAEVLLSRLQQSVKINVTRYRRDSLLGKTTREHNLDTASLVRSQIMKASRLARIRQVDAKRLHDLHICILSNTSSGEATRQMLLSLGYSVTLINVNEATLPIKKLQNGHIDLVFNLCETHPESPLFRPNVAALLEMLQIPFTGSGSSTTALAMDKITVKKLLDYHEIPTPKWDYVDDVNDEITENLTFPLIVKPSNADDYHGISAASVVSTPQALRKQTQVILQDFKRPALVEEYIEGDELDVCIFGNGDDVEVFPIIRSVFDRMPKEYWHIYSTDLMRKENGDILKSIRVEQPAKISPKLNTLISEMALDIYQTFDCRDYAKIEIRVDKQGNPFVLELNPNPGLDPDDFFPLAAKLAGYSYEDLLETIFLIAAERYQARIPATLLT